MPVIHAIVDEILQTLVNVDDQFRLRPKDFDRWHEKLRGRGDLEQVVDALVKSALALPRETKTEGVAVDLVALAIVLVGDNRVRAALTTDGFGTAENRDALFTRAKQRVKADGLAPPSSGGVSLRPKKRR